MVHLLDVLRSAGGTLPSTEVFEELRRSGSARLSDLETLQSSGETRFAKEVRFARLELVAASLLDCPVGGVWSLSETGWSTFLTPDDACSLVSARRRGSTLPGSRPSQLPVSGPTRGLPPTSWTAMVARDVGGIAFTHILQFGEADIWKVGYANDVPARLAQVNRHVPYEHLGRQWTLFAKRRWPDAPAAFAMEQRLLGLLQRQRTVGERVGCPRSTIVKAWRTCMEAI